MLTVLGALVKGCRSLKGQVVMNRQKRVQTIRKRVREAGSLQLSSVAHEFGVSEMTIRRDLEDILLDPEIQLIRGTFLHLPEAPKGGGEPYSLLTASLQNREAKERIARRALSMIEAGENLLFDAGTTIEILASLLPNDHTGSALCFSYNVLTRLLSCPNMSISITGGRFHRRSMLFESREGVELLRRRRVHKAFMSAGGIHRRLGVTCSDEYETDLKKAGLEAAEQRILLADSSKFGSFTACHFADIDEFDIIITDNLLDKSSRKVLEKGNIELVLV